MSYVHNTSYDYSIQGSVPHKIMQVYNYVFLKVGNRKKKEPIMTRNYVLI